MKRLRSGKVRLGGARCGQVRHGTARCGTVRRGRCAPEAGVTIKHSPWSRSAQVPVDAFRHGGGLGGGLLAVELRVLVA